mgnify:CR=1 FL=1
MPKLTVGTDDFQEMRREGGYFVDKSMLVREVIGGSKCLLLPRPRRFGKTLNLSMLRYFFEKSEQTRRELFEGLRITEDADAMQHQGRYPVISLSLKSVRAHTWADARNKLGKKIADLYLAYDELEDTLPKIHRSAFRDICEGTADDPTLHASLANLISYLHDYHGEPVIVLLDEYDTPIIQAWEHGYYDEMIEFMRCWLGEGLKHEDGSALYRAVVTGILRVARESIFSGLNNLVTWTTLRSGPFADKFGFTQPEVDKLLSDFDARQLAEPINEWYNGYSFGGTTIYNPWSVVNCVLQGPDSIGPQWLNTASNQLVYDELEAGGLSIQRDIENMLMGEELRYPISESIVFADIGRRTQSIWTFLYFSGYLRADDPERNPLDETEKLWRLNIPNLEVSIAYRQFVNRIYADALPDGVKSLLNCFTKDRAAEDFEHVLQELVLSLVSHHDVARRPEAVFHAFVLGLLANLRRVYEIQSNAECGYGRADIIMRPKTERYPLGYVIEFKSVDEGADLETALDDALRQIDARDYPARLRSAGVAPENIRRLAVVLCGEKLRVRRAPPAGRPTA